MKSSSKKPHNDVRQSSPSVLDCKRHGISFGVILVNASEISLGNNCSAFQRFAPFVPYCDQGPVYHVWETPPWSFSCYACLRPILTPPWLPGCGHGENKLANQLGTDGWSEWWQVWGVFGEEGWRICEVQVICAFVKETQTFTPAQAHLFTPHYTKYNLGIIFERKNQYTIDALHTLIIHDVWCCDNLIDILTFWHYDILTFWIFYILTINLAFWHFEFFTFWQLIWHSDILNFLHFDN